MDDEKKKGPPQKREPRPDGRALIEPACDGTLTLVKPDGTVLEKVRPALAWPLRHHDRYIAILDEAGKEAFMATSLDSFAPECRELLRAEVERRYVDTRILSVLELRVQRRVSYWTVETDRGPREFVVQGSDTNPYRFDERRWLVSDVAGNRYQIDDITSLDGTSRMLLEELES